MTISKFTTAGILLWIFGSTGCGHAPLHKGERLVPASDPALLYSGRWDMTDPARPRASWPGFAVSTDIQGKSIQVHMADTGNYFNVEVDGKFVRVIGGKSGSNLSYMLADDLAKGVHRVRLQRRNINFDGETEIQGFVVNRDARLTRPPATGKKHIEFIGDSYTAAEGCEAVSLTLPWEKKFPVTDFSKGYAAVLGELMDAEVTAVCRSGSGLVTTWNGKREHPMGERYDWTMMEEAAPAWKFDEAPPDMVVVSLGLNDFSGLKGADGEVSASSSGEFRLAYQGLIDKVRRRHPGTRILALAPFNPWARQQIAEVVRQEKSSGFNDVAYAQFDNFPDGYVADGHPTVATHRLMAGRILAQLKELGLASASGALVDR